MKTLLSTTALLLLITASAMAGAKPGWTDDYTAAQAKAKAENKHVLLDFTGSDWCGWCMKLDKEVFSKPGFKSLAREKLELVELDYPKSKPLTQKVKSQNAEMKSSYDIHGYPTIILLDSDGKEVKRWGGYSAKLLDELKATLSTTSAR